MGFAEERARLLAAIAYMQPHVVRLSHKAPQQLRRNARCDTSVRGGGLTPTYATPAGLTRFLGQLDANR